jgi:hypothetical protein
MMVYANNYRQILSYSREMNLKNRLILNKKPRMTEK